MTAEKIPFLEQYPGDEAASEDLLAWAQKARARIQRDTVRISELNYKNSKLQKQLVSQQKHSEKIRAKIAVYENSSLWGLVKLWWSAMESENKNA